MDSYYENHRLDDQPNIKRDWSKLRDKTIPFCAGCGVTYKLTEVGVRPGHPYYLCPRCKREEGER